MAWWLYRYDKLILEGFSPEECAVLCDVRISRPAIRKIRRQRKRIVAYYLLQLPEREAILAARDYARGTDWETLTWDDFVRVVYPERYRRFG